MIGPEHLPTRQDGVPARRRRVVVVTGSRADFGLLRPVMRAVRDHAELELLVIAAGSHLVPPAETFRDVRAEFEVADSIPMQVAGRTTRADDAEAVGKGAARFARSFAGSQPDWVVVLGDRIEVLAAASAASVGGWPIAHIHGGDRAEGIADEAIRHAVTKLAHVHLAATPGSAERIVRMGERADCVHVVGSPAVDDLADLAPMRDAAYADLGQPQVVMLLHPLGRSSEQEEHVASMVLEGLASLRVLALEPNHDPGREGIVRAIRLAGEQREDLRTAGHMPRSAFVGLLKRLARGGDRGASAGVLVGNSSAGLIECAALGCPVVNVGARQAGREYGPNVIHVGEVAEAIRTAIARAMMLTLDPRRHPYGDGFAGRRIADVLARTDGGLLLRKRCAY